MKEGETIKGLIGWEWHGYPLRNLPGMEILASGGTGTTKAGKPRTPHAATIYDGPKNNVVFNAGQILDAPAIVDEVVIDQTLGLVVDGHTLQEYLHASISRYCCDPASRIRSAAPSRHAGP